MALRQRIELLCSASLEGIRCAVQSSFVPWAQGCRLSTGCTTTNMLEGSLWPLLAQCCTIGVNVFAAILHCMKALICFYAQTFSGMFAHCAADGGCGDTSLLL